MNISRRDVRELEFVLLFGLEFNDREDMKRQIDLFFEKENKLNEEIEEDLIPDNIIAEISKRVLDIVEKVDEIDDMIKNHIEKWSIDRIGKEELTILRIGVFEMKYDDTIPVPIAINEAVELCKIYGQEDAGAFVNAVLAKIV